MTKKEAQLVKIQLYLKNTTTAEWYRITQVLESQKETANDLTLITKSTY